MCNPSMEFQPRVHEVVIYSDLRTSHLFPLNSRNTKPFLCGHYPHQQFSTCYPHHAAHAGNPLKCTLHYQELLLGWLTSTYTPLHIYEWRHCTGTKCIYSVHSFICQRINSISCSVALKSSTVFPGENGKGIANDVIIITKIILTLKTFWTTPRKLLFFKF